MRLARKGLMGSLGYNIEEEMKLLQNISQRLELEPIFCSNIDIILEQIDLERE